MEEIISKKELDEFKQFKGEVRGSEIRNQMGFIREEEGEDGLKRLEDIMAELGYPVKYQKMGRMKLYPLELQVVLLVVIQRIFNYDDKKFQKMGWFQMRFSVLLKTAMKYLISVERAVKGIEDMWSKHYTIGTNRMIKFDKEKKYAISRLENFRVHPIFCQVIKGIFSGVIQMAGEKKISCEETKCTYRGDEYHEFLLKW